MTLDEFMTALEKYYGDQYPPAVRVAMTKRYNAAPWGNEGRKQLYELVILKHSRQFRIAPDLAVLGPLEEAALDQRDIVMLERKPIPGQKMLAGPTPEQMEENRQKLSEALALLAKRLRGAR